MEETIDDRRAKLNVIKIKLEQLADEIRTLHGEQELAGLELMKNLFHEHNLEKMRESSEFLQACLESMIMTENAFTILTLYSLMYGD